MAQVLWTWGNDSPAIAPPRLKTWGTGTRAEETHDATHPPPFQGGEGEERPRTTGSAMFAGRRPSLHPWLHSWTPLGSQKTPPELSRTRRNVLVEFILAAPLLPL